MFANPITKLILTFGTLNGGGRGCRKSTNGDGLVRSELSRMFDLDSH